MGWGADVLVAVRGPVRNVDLFRHQFRRFWETYDDYSCKRAWMRVHFKQHSPSPPPAHEWWLEQAVHPGTVGEARLPVVNSPVSLVVLAARQCAACSTPRSLASDLLLLPEELRTTVLSLGMSTTQLAQLLRHLVANDCTAASDGNGEAEADHHGDGDGDDRAALKMVSRLVAEGMEGELLYQACLRKETLENAVAQLAPTFPRLTIFLLAAPESWAGQAFDRIYMGSETADPGLAMAENRCLHETFHIDDARDLRSGEWRSFAFDVLAYDHEFKWGLDEPCPCTECHDARQLGLCCPTPPSKNVEQVWSST